MLAAALILLIFVQSGCQCWARLSGSSTTQVVVNKQKNNTVSNDDDTTMHYKRWIPPLPYAHFTVDLKSHPKVLEAIDTYQRRLEEMVPEQIDIFANFGMMGNADDGGGMVAFCLSTGDFYAGLNASYTMVITRKGDIKALRVGDSYSMHGSLYARRYEAIQPFNSSTFMMIAHETRNATVDASHNRILLWDFVTGREEFVPYNGSSTKVDSHDILYIPKTDSFLVAEQAESAYNTTRLINWSRKTQQNIWVLDFQDLNIPADVFNIGMHINKFQLINENLILASSRNVGAVYFIEIDEKGNGKIRTVYGGPSSDAEFYDIAGGKVLSFWERFTHNTEVFFSPGHQQDLQSPHTFMTFDNAADFKGCVHSTRFLEYQCITKDERLVCTETWQWSTGDRAEVFGDADLLLSGNILGTSWGEHVDPSDPNQEGYHCHIYEVDRAKDTAWSLSVKPYWSSWMSSNPSEAYDRADNGIPLGWSLYSAENIYSEPIVQGLSWDSVSESFTFTAFNTHRTSHQSPAVIKVETSSGEMIYQENILLNEMWLPSRVELHAASLTQHFLNMKVLHFILENEWGYLSKKYSIWAEK